MRKFITGLDGAVDLDNPKTYKYLPNDVRKLDDKMFTEIGKALVYMDWLPSRMDGFPKKKIKISPAKIKVRKFSSRKEADLWYNCGWYQRQRVYKLIVKFVKGRHQNWKNVMWFKEQVFVFQEETDNMC